MNFPILMQRLEDPPGLADLHLAVVSTDMGAGDGSIAGCDANGGKNGVFQFAPRGGCGASGLEPGATYISNVGGVKNYTGKIEDVIACIAPLGESGCGFEHPLAAAARALGADGRARPRREPGVPAARSIPVRRGGDERRRLLGAARVGPVRHQGERVPRLDAGSADELSLQRVRPPLQRPETAPQAAHRPRVRRRVAGRVRFGGAPGLLIPGGHDRRSAPDAQAISGRADSCRRHHRAGVALLRSLDTRAGQRADAVGVAGVHRQRHQLGGAGRPYHPMGRQLRRKRRPHVGMRRRLRSRLRPGGASSEHGGGPDRNGR